MNNLHRKELIQSTYERTDDISLVKETIDKVQEILWFKKIIAFSGWGNWIQVENSELQKKISLYSDELKYEIVDNIMKRLKDYEVAILTWWTTWDIPCIASESARKYNLPTIWVLPKKGEKNSMWKDFLNAEIIISPIYWESHYWDESSVFAKLADWVFMIWWWAWTLVEFSHVMKINEALRKNNKEIKKIIPITWIPWVSDAANFIPWNQEIKNLTFPNKNITEPKVAFDLLRRELQLDDILREEY